MKQREWYPFSPSVDAVMVGEVATHAPVLVIHLWAEWNGQDRVMDRILLSLQREYSDRAEFRSMDVDDEMNLEFLTEQQVVNIPGLLFYVAERFAGMTLGLISAKALRSRLESLMGTGVANP